MLKQHFCFALKLFRLGAQFVGARFIRDQIAGVKHKGQLGENKHDRELSHLIFSLCYGTSVAFAGLSALVTASDGKDRRNATRSTICVSLR